MLMGHGGGRKRKGTGKKGVWHGRRNHQRRENLVHKAHREEIEGLATRTADEFVEAAMAPLPPVLEESTERSVRRIRSTPSTTVRALGPSSFARRSSIG